MGSSRNRLLKEHVRKRKMACHAKSHLLYPQMIMLKVNSEYAQYILSMQTARLCYTQPLNKGIYAPMNILLRQTLSVTPLQNLLVNQDLESEAEFNIFQNLHLRTQKSVCATIYGPFVEIGANFSLQLHRGHSLLKLIIKKVIPVIQCEKHKKIEFSGLYTL